jgi:hypothetical protein
LNSPADICRTNGNPKNSTGCDETTLPAEFIAVCVLAFVAGVLATAVNDVDANARPDLVRVGHKLPVHVARNDDALGAADVSKNTASAGLPLLHGVWILRYLAGSRC